MKKLIMLSLIALTAACSNNAVVGWAENDVVVQRADNLRARPEWVQESRPSYCEDGWCYYIGIATAQGNTINRSMLYDKAANDARDKIAADIENKIQTIFQNVAEGYNVNSTQTQKVSTETRNLVLTNVRRENQYFEKILGCNNFGTDGRGNPQCTNRGYRYEGFVRMRISEAHLRSYFDRGLRDAGVSADLQEKARTLWDRAVSEM